MDISLCNQTDITFCKSCNNWKHISEHIENISFFKYCTECRENKKKEKKKNKKNKIKYISKNTI